MRVNVETIISEKIETILKKQVKFVKKNKIVKNYE